MMCSLRSNQWLNKSKSQFLPYGDDVYLRKLEADVPIYYYGVSENDDIQARNIRRTTTGSAFDVYHGEGVCWTFRQNQLLENTIF